MKNFFWRYLMVLSILIIAQQGFSETPEEYRVKDSDLNIQAAKANLNNIEIALKDFRGFTAIILNDKVLNKLKENKNIASTQIRANDLKRFSSLDWSTQNIGFNNWVLVLRGSLLKSAYLAKKYEYELAKCRKNLSEKELFKLEKEVNDAFIQYQKFLSHATYSD